MKDSTDKGTGDMFGEKRGRGRPKTGTAKTKAVHNGTPSVELTPLQAGELLKAIRAAERQGSLSRMIFEMKKPLAGRCYLIRLLFSITHAHV